MTDLFELCLSLFALIIYFSDAFDKVVFGNVRKDPHHAEQVLTL